VAQPAQSPDLNMIEPVWDYLMRQKQLSLNNKLWQAGQTSKIKTKPPDKTAMDLKEKA